MKEKGILKKLNLLSLVLLLAFLFISPVKIFANDKVTADLWNEEEYLGRTYDEKYDRMYDDFQRSDVEIAPVESAIESIEINGLVSFDNETPYFKAKYSSDVSNTPDDSIIKGASSHNEQSITFPYLILRLRGYEGANIDDLVLAFRRDDSHQLLEIPFNEVLDNEGELIQNFDGTFQTYVISISETIYGLQYVPNSEGEAIDVDRAVGFHLYAKEGNGIIDTKYAFLSKTADVTTADVGSNSFPILAGQTDGGQGYWGGSTGTKITKWLIMKDQSNYLSFGQEAANFDSLYENFVLSIKGSENADLASISIAPYFEDGIGSEKQLSDVFGPDGKALPELTTNFTNYVISFTENGWGKNALGFKIFFDGDELNVKEMFLTNLEILPPADSYPILDADTALVFDNFNRENVGETHVYDADNPVAKTYGFDYIIDYSASNGLSIDDGALSMTVGNGSYAQYNVRSSVRYNNDMFQYAVFKIKTIDNMSLQKFRFATKNSNDQESVVKWSHELYAAPGLLSIPTDLDQYEYVDSDEWMYIIVDLELTGFGTNVYGFTLYIDGEGALLIDSIMFMNQLTLSSRDSDTFIIDDYDREDLVTTPNSLHWLNVEAGDALITEGTLKLDGTSGFVQVAMGIKHPGSRYLAFEARAEEGSSFAFMRLGFPDADKWFKDDILLNPIGTPIKNATTEWQTYVIDLKLSGLNPGDTLRIANSDNQVIYFDNLRFIEPKNIIWETEYIVDDYNRESLTPAPSSVYWNNAEGGGTITLVDGAMRLDGTTGFTQYAVGFQTNGYRYLSFKIKAEEGSNLSTLRMTFKDGGEFVWFANNEILNYQGNPISDATTEWQTVIIDVLATFGEQGSEVLRIAVDGDQVVLIDDLKIYQGFGLVAGLESVSNMDLSGLLKIGKDTVKIGSTWVDAGLNSTDKYITIGSVNTDIAGRYLVTYLLNNQVIVKRYVNVVEETSQVEIKLNMGLDTITTGSVWIDAGAAVKVDGVNKTLTVTGTVDTSKTGTYQIKYSIIVNEVTYSRFRYVHVK